MGMGIPLIASKISPFEELVESGKNGVLIEGKDPQEYAAAIADGRDYSQAAQVYVLENFSWEKCFEQYESIFRDFKRKNG